MIARRYHDLTAHSPASVRSSAHALEWDIKPYPFKIYTELPALALPRDLDALAGDTLAALAGPAPDADRLELATLAAILYYAAGVTKKKTYPGGGEVLFRAAPSTGALYQTEVYVAAGAVEGLEPGLYHFCPGDFALRRLRAGDVREPLARAAADERPARCAATVVLTAIYWRNTWKYQARGYRHLFWDSGTLLANLLAVAGALGQAPGLLTGFVDADVNRLLGVDPDREAALELVTLGPAGAPAPPADALPEIRHESMPLSSAEVDYPLLREVHAATALADAGAVRDWRAASARWGGGRGALPETTPAATRDADSMGASVGSLPDDTGLRERPPAPTPPPPARTPVALPRPRAASGRGLGETIQRRASTRAFGHEPLTAEELATALWAATRGLAADVPVGHVELGVIVNAVTDVAPGAYVYRADRHALAPVRLGDFRRESAHLCLEQPLGGDAAAAIYFLAPLDAWLAAAGERAYRLANLEAGIAGGRAYLAAYALGFGASGLTFYDGDVVRFFAPHSAGGDAIFVTVLGRAAREGRATIGQQVTLAGRPSR
ncbi:MAG: SagB family peptide dehydrogenase [Candidatus Rokubacteria bacterium]|nr:SagB family peptide dehydrogenase [Candidatus Rokubacteria bacterium]